MSITPDELAVKLQHPNPAHARPRPQRQHPRPTDAQLTVEILRLEEKRALLVAEAVAYHSPAGYKARALAQQTKEVRDAQVQEQLGAAVAALTAAVAQEWQDAEDERAAQAQADAARAWLEVLIAQLMTAYCTDDDDSELQLDCED